MGTQGTMRLAIAGMGNMGSAHVQTASTLARVELVGICDVDQARVDRAARTPLPGATPTTSRCSTGRSPTPY